MFSVNLIYSLGVFFIHTLNINNEHFRDLHGFTLVKKRIVYFYASKIFKSLTDPIGLKSI